MQNINLNRDGLTAEKILEKRKSHCELTDWIAKPERWQRTANRAHWLGEQAGSWGS